MKALAMATLFVTGLGALPVAAEVDVAALAGRVAAYWMTDDAMAQSRVVLRVSFAANGKPTGFQRIEAEGPSPDVIDRLEASARRAVNRAYADGGLPLPADNYDTWRVLDLVFDANGMRAR